MSCLMTLSPGGRGCERSERVRGARIGASHDFRLFRPGEPHPHSLPQGEGRS
jgi:hypothetical protein